MRTKLLFGLCIGLVIASGTVAFEPRAKPNVGGAPIEQPKRKVDLQLDEKSAVQIAEIVLAKVYGQNVLKEKPWTVTADDASFKIEGTLPKGMLGGVALIRISRTNAEVTELIHGK